MILADIDQAELRYRIKRLGGTQAQVAARLGLSLPGLVHQLSGTHPVSRQTALILSLLEEVSKLRSEVQALTLNRKKHSMLDVELLRTIIAQLERVAAAIENDEPADAAVENIKSAQTAIENDEPAHASNVLNVSVPPNALYEFTAEDSVRVRRWCPKFFVYIDKNNARRRWNNVLDKFKENPDAMLENAFQIVKRAVQTSGISTHSPSDMGGALNKFYLG